MKKLINSRSHRVRNTNTNSWKTYTMQITIHVLNNKIHACTSVEDEIQSFFNQMIDHLSDADFLPYYSIELMQKMFHSNRSDSEYYIFLKLTDDEKIKLILDIRFSDHSSPEHGDIDSHDRHIDYMETVRRKEISETLGIDCEDSEVDFIDISYKDPSKFFEIDIDKQQTFSVDEALRVFDSKIDKLK